MIDLAFVESLIRALDESSLDNLELERGGTRVRLSKSPQVQPAANTVQGGAPSPTMVSGADSSIIGMPAAPQAGPADQESQDGAEGASDAGLLEVTSPMVGTFYSSPAPDVDPYVEVGKRVGNGTVLCIIEAMKLMNELESEVEGIVAKVLVENAQPVEYGQVLFLIDPS